MVLLKKEFPTLKSYRLPSYKIKYAKKGKNLKFKLLISFPSAFFAVQKEKRIVQKIIEKENLAGIISDNRFGVYHDKIPSVYITHQVNVLSGKTTTITSKIHQKIIRKFSECWIPDIDSNKNLSGILGHSIKSSFPIKYIGPINRLNYHNLDKKYDILVLLSGPEPQRSMLETKLMDELKVTKQKVLFVRGIFSNSTLKSKNKNIIFKNYLLTLDLELAMNESELIISRSGYSTIMDLAKLGKKAFFIPTPGQYEQEYLATKFMNNGIAPFSNQEDFCIEKLNRVQTYSGFKRIKSEIQLELFELFQGK